MSCQLTFLTSLCLNVDCINFNLEYPDCEIEYPHKIGDGKTCSSKQSSLCCIRSFSTHPRFNYYTIILGNCDEEYLTVECGFDGLDCCTVEDHSMLGDHTCHYWKEDYNTLKCGYDNFDW